MKINIPKVIVPVELNGYAAELAGQFLQVWVNPPQEKLKAYDALVTDLQQQELTRARKILLPEQEPARKKASVFAPIFAQVEHWLKVKKEEKPQGLDTKMLEWYAEIWSQGPQDSQWSVEELRTLEAQDPTFLSWMIAQTWKTRTAHIENKKKS